ncbi:unnamed protein product [Blepharisma stoltei]|uniref:Uncharacterized protein n=1 Tax=Blepharisma stoltei TaxID=1481888 RepID=A0AAU9KDI3_9CILI|nr:unnamed protein product [Blepharisma stoltei]
MDKLAKAQKFLSLSAQKPIPAYSENTQLKLLSISDVENERKALAGCELDLAIIRDNYIKSQDLPKWKQKILLRRLFITCIGGLWVLVYSYGKIERIMDFFDYSIYIR